MKRAILVLETGDVFEGISIGKDGTTVGEVVFNTAMSGYQEILTDPSYKGQIVNMTYTQIGNYGLNDEDNESDRPFVEGFVVKEASVIHSNFRAKETLNEYLKRHSIVGIAEIDTRKLTKLLRVKGSLRGGITTEDNIDSLKKAVENFEIVNRDLVQFVSTKEPYEFNDGLFRFGFENRKIKKVLSSKRVVVLDFGVKRNILRYLIEVGFDVVVLPAYSTYNDVASFNPDAVFLSNGPGDPRGIDSKWIEEYRKIITNYPSFGICFGHQIIARAFGVDVYKMKFGHHGGNHPVKEIESDNIFVTAQNHNYAADEKSLLEKGFKITYKNLNDGSVEGMMHKELPVMSVQFHPEASPGPHDAEGIFENFATMVKENC
ncbi:glutamine-hydrolyzing carbamoyl-phosphate synthase small subunit [Hippea maritima]|uniref:Carbamoyl phosphate synthase small chain n=1 Tax=Hippea maritima (strain ATCC 700847 / DSM 10411 / MH2) TaxID=760142 RepID=F2LW14_HIPMA|nr:glutamine-hydrolyzing carbamoyl-phosphate synthase small subunit [Hippea maritima]AEA33948.1 carbamoyl-phosphate synthase, small subunit [Hippea maritima DSM 10411]